MKAIASGGLHCGDVKAIYGLYKSGVGLPRVWRCNPGYCQLLPGQRRTITWSPRPATVCPGEPGVRFDLYAVRCRKALRVYRRYAQSNKAPRGWACAGVACLALSERRARPAIIWSRAAGA